MSSCPRPPTRGPQAVPSPPPGTPPARGPGRTRGNCQSCGPEGVHTPHVRVRCAEPAEQLRGTYKPGRARATALKAVRVNDHRRAPATLPGWCPALSTSHCGHQAWGGPVPGGFIWETQGDTAGHAGEGGDSSSGHPAHQGQRAAGSQAAPMAYSPPTGDVFFKLEGRHPTWECQKVRGKPEQDMPQPRLQIPPGEARLAGGQHSGQRSRREEALAGQGSRRQRPPLQAGPATQQTLLCDQEKELLHGCW